MLKKILTLFMAFMVLSSSVFAQGTDSIKIAFEELNYALTVEWDQKDQAFHDAETKKFQKKITEGVENGIFTKEEMLAFALTQIKDQKVAKEVESTLNLLKLGVLSEMEAVKLTSEMLKRSHATGAAWHFDVESPVHLAVMFAGIGVTIALLIIFFGDCPDAGCGPRPPRAPPAWCYQELVCNSSYCWYEERCFDDGGNPY